jgi:threonine aldolase
MARERYEFASDNTAGICPEAWTAMEAANRSFVPSYGEDAWTARAADAIRDIFEAGCEVFFAFNGTAANSLALASLCQSYHSILCHELSHIETDECGGPEFFSNGTKILLVGGKGGKVDPAALRAAATRRTDLHFPKPRVLSVTQATECGTVYTVDELARLGREARKLGLKFHMDGARFANALVALGAKPKDISWKAGVDVLCLGGVKNGLATGEAVVFFDRKLAGEFEYRCKQAGQLASKMRFISAPWAGLLSSGAWLRNAAHANRMARLLEAGFRSVPGVKVVFRGKANAVFARMPEGTARALRRMGWHFYDFIGVGGCRFMCSWATRESDVRELVESARIAARHR